jgi:hypothetical protein
MTNKKIWLGMLVIVLVFGMMAVGCLSLDNIGVPPTDDGKGGVVRIRNTSSSTDYWYYLLDSSNDRAYATLDSSGRIIPNVYVLHVNGYSPVLNLRNDCTLTVRYQTRAQGENMEPAINTGYWDSKSVNVSNDESFIIEIP